MFRRILKWTLRILALLVIALAIFLINLIWFRPWSLNLFYEKVFAQVLFEEPELLSSLGLVERFGITGHNGKLGDVSPAHQQRYFDRAKKNLEDLHAYPLEKQNPSQQLSTHILEWYMSREIEGEKYQFHNYPVNQLFGVQNEFPSFMANTHRLLAPRDCEYYQQRLNAVGTKFDQLLESLKLREQKGILPPRFVVEKVLVEMNNFVAQPAAENILATSFKTRAAKIGEIFEWRADTIALEIGRRVVRRGGAALIIDYGHRESAIGETLQAVGAHEFAEPLLAPGLLDLTAHVDFQALAQAAEGMGARVHGPLPQGEFLRRLGIEQRAAALKAAAPPDYAATIDAARGRLTSEDRTGMGRLFKAIAVANPKLDVLPGFET